MMQNPLKIFTKINIIVLILFAFTLLICVRFLFPFSDTEDEHEIPFSAKTIQLGIFEKYNNKIYASVPSNGNYLIPEADFATFHLVSDDLQYRQLAVDKNQVYCGNIPLKNIQPTQVKTIGNSYFTDGTDTWYCAPSSERNPDLGAVHEFFQTILQSFALASKPQSYIYPFYKLERGQQPYIANQYNGIAHNETHTYYEGRLLPQANPNQIKFVSDDQDIPYLSDGQHVYYNQTLLNLKDNGHLESFDIDGVNQQHYLYNPQDGMVYVNQLPFDPQYAPYRVVSESGDHVNHVLFYAKSGVFFYDPEKEKVQRAGDNPFSASNYKEISPLIFSDGKTLIYLQSRRHHSRQEQSSTLSTSILKLNEPLHGDWEKVGDVYQNAGSVWKNGQSFYYFDQLGDSHIIKKTIYRIKDHQTVDYLLNDSPRIDDIRDLIEDHKIVEPEHITLVEAKSMRHSDQYYWAIVFPIALIVMFSAMMWLIHRFKLNFKPFYISNNKLVATNLLMSSYPLAEIACVEFSIDPTSRGQGYIGRFNLLLKNGQRTRKFKFSSQTSWRSDQYEELEQYIQKLIQDLAVYDVQSILIQDN